jgi:coenzyme F420-0:L-glutamate ligase/coenzyme F420-1:gamma-L-glutamate ligase
MMTLLPDDPDESARRLREGVEAIDSNFGRTDLYGQPKVGGVDLVADELTAVSALLFGQTDEQAPLVVVRGLEYEDGRGVPNSSGIVRRGLRKSIELTARLKAREWF